MPKIDGHTSDLFFNLDHSAAVVKDGKGQFDGWNEEKMTDQAIWFCEAISAIGGPIYLPPDIIADFHARV